jgi:hypothetical protein
MEYVVDIQGLHLLGVETDPMVTRFFSEGEEVRMEFADGCIQVLPAKAGS